MELHKTALRVIKEEEGGSPCAVEVQKGLLCAAAFTFFSVISLSLPPSQSVSVSLGGVCVLKGHPSGLSEVGVLQVR